MKLLKPVLHLASAAALLCVLTMQGAAASSFRINPVLLEVQPDKASAVLTIENHDDVPVSVRLQAKSWRQEGGKDVYEEATDLLMSPPIATIPAHGKQIVRIGRRGPSTPGEKSYRIIVEEIPTASPGGNAVVMALRFDLPMYLLAAAPEPAKLEWKAWRDGSGRIMVEAANGAASRAEILQLAWDDGAGGRAELKERAGVVLSKSSKRWTLGSQPAGSDNLTLFVRTAAGETKIELAVQNS